MSNSALWIDELRAADELEELIRDLHEPRLAREVLTLRPWTASAPRSMSRSGFK